MSNKSWLQSFLSQLPGTHFHAKGSHSRRRLNNLKQAATEHLETRTMLSAFVPRSDHLTVDWHQTGEATSLPLLQNDDLTPDLVDGDINNGEISIHIPNQPSWLTINGQDVQFIPPATYQESLSFDYQLYDGTTYSALATATLDLIQSEIYGPVQDDTYTIQRHDDLLGEEGTWFEYEQTGEGQQDLAGRPEASFEEGLGESGSITGYDLVFGEDFIPVDTSKAYTVSGWFKTEAGTTPTNYQYLGFAEYDADYNHIHPYHVIASVGSQNTYLAQDYNPATDSTIVLQGDLEALGWHNGSVSHARNLAFLGYTTGDGVTHESYTRYATSTGNFWHEVGSDSPEFNPFEVITYNEGLENEYTETTIHLPSAGNTSKFFDLPASGIFPAGTEVRNSQHHSPYNYSMSGGGAVDSDWNYLIQTISGVNTQDQRGWGQFRDGVKYVKPVLHVNYHNIFDGGSDVFEFKEFRFGETKSLLTTANPLSVHNSEYAQAVFDQSESLSVIGGNQLSHSDELIRVNPTEGYRLNLSLRSGDGQGGEYIAANSHTIGLEQYDLSGNLLATSVQQLSNVTDQWTDYSLLFTGQSSTALPSTSPYQQFHPDVAYVRPVIEANTNGETANRLQARDVVFGYATILSDDLSENVTFEGGQETYTTTAWDGIVSDEYLAVDTNRQYEISVDIRVEDINGTGDDSLHYFGFASYDIDRNLIHPLNYTRHSGSLDAELAVDYDPYTNNPLYLSGDLSDWAGRDPNVVWSDYFRQLAFLNYTDSVGNTYDNYSRYATDGYKDVWDTGGIVEGTYATDANGDLILSSGEPVVYDAQNSAHIGSTQLWKITLNSDVIIGNMLHGGASIDNGLDANGNIPAGTMVRNTRAGGGYNYAVLSAANLGGNGDWNTYTGSIVGREMPNGEQNVGEHHPGAKYIKLLGLLNWHNDSDEVTVTNSEISIANASLRRVTHINGQVSINLDVLTNDAVAQGITDAEIVSISDPYFGTAEIIQGDGIGTQDSIQYTTAAWFAGSDMLTYTIEDADGQQHTATVRVNALGSAVESEVDTNDGGIWQQLYSQTDPSVNTSAPVAFGDDWINYEAVSTSASTQLLTNDTTDSGETTLIKLVSAPEHGAFRFEADGTMTYHNPEYLLETDNFMYELTDGLHRTIANASMGLRYLPDVVDHVFELPENSNYGDSVGTITATDHDAGQSLSYTITEGNESGNFSINSTTGEITFYPYESIDYEAEDPVYSYILTVDVTDDGPTPLTETILVGVYITDENDNAPVIDIEEGATFTTIEISELAGAYSAHGELTFTDPDTIGEYEWELVGTIPVGQNSEPIFDINEYGQIVVLQPDEIDFEDLNKNDYTLSVQLTDGVHTTAAHQVNVIITNENDQLEQWRAGSENLPTDLDYLGLLSNSPLNPFLGGLVTVLETSVDEALTAVENAQNQGQSSGGSGSSGGSSQTTGSPLLTLPTHSGFSFEALTLPMLTGGGDVLAVQPNGTTSFDNTTQNNFVPITATNQSADQQAETETTGFATSSSSQTYVSPTEYSITQSVTNSYTDTIDLSPLGEDDGVNPVTATPESDDDTSLSREIAETFSISIIDGAQAVYTYTITNNVSYLGGQLAGVTDQTPGQLNIPQAWKDAVDDSLEEPDEGTEPVDPPIWDTLFGSPTAPPTGDHEIEESTFGGVFEAASTLTMTLTETIVTVPGGGTGRKYDISFSTSSSSTSLAAGQENYSSSEGTLEDVDWEEVFDEDANSTSGGGSGGQTGSSSAPTNDPPSNPAEDLTGDGDGESVNANSNFLEYGSSSNGMGINLSTTVADGAAIDSGETTGSISVNSNSDGGGMSNGSIAIDIQDPEIGAIDQWGGRNEKFNYISFNDTNNISGNGSSDFDAELEIGNTLNTSTDSSDWITNLFNYTKGTQDSNNLSVFSVDTNRYRDFESPFNQSTVNHIVWSETNILSAELGGSFSADLNIGLDGITTSSNYESFTRNTDRYNYYIDEGWGVHENLLLPWTRSERNSYELVNKGGIGFDSTGLTLTGEYTSTWDHIQKDSVPYGSSTTPEYNQSVLDFSVNTIGGINGFDTTVTVNENEDPQDLISDEPPVIDEVTVPDTNTITVTPQVDGLREYLLGVYPELVGEVDAIVGGMNEASLEINEAGGPVRFKTSPTSLICDEVQEIVWMAMQEARPNGVGNNMCSPLGNRLCVRQVHFINIFDMIGSHNWIEIFDQNTGDTVVTIDLWLWDDGPAWRPGIHPEFTRNYGAPYHAPEPSLGFEFWDPFSTCP